MLGFKRIIMTTDLSDYSLRAVPYAAALTQVFGGRLDVIHVHQPDLPSFSEVGTRPGSKPSEQEIYARQEMKKLMEERVPDWVDAVGHVLVGNPANEIIRYAKAEHADLIVIATHGAGKLAHALMGSVAEEVVRHAPCPVFTLKQPMTVAPPKASHHPQHATS